MGRRNVGKEIDNFVKTFLAVTKMGQDRDRADRRDAETKRMNDARIALYNARAGQMGKGMPNFDQYIREHMNGGNAANGGGTPRTTEEQRVAAQERMNYLVNEKGADPKVAAAIVGNTWHEGAGFQTTVRGDNGNSFGEFQFNNKGEMPAFTAWARANNRDVNDWKSQYDFVWDARLKGPYKQVLQRMQEAPDERAAAQVFMSGYERPSIPHLGNRQNYAGLSLKMHTSGRQAGRAAETASGAMDGLPEAPKTASAPAAVPLPPQRPASIGTPRQPEAGASGDDWSQDAPQGMSDDFGSQAASGDDRASIDWASKSDDVADPNVGDDWSEGFAEGGMVGETALPMGDSAPQPQPAPEAPLPEALDAALKAVQSGYQLGREDAALPGTDTERNGRMQAFHQGEGAVSPEQYDALLQGVGGPDPSASALQQIYGFYAQKDPRQAAQAAAGVLQAARARSMEYGHKAGQALDQRDYQGAAQALAAAYNEVPDGRSVTAEVNEQGVGRAIVKDARSGKVVEELPLEPRALMQFASGFMGGGEFYNHLARIAQPTGGSQGGQEAGVPMQGYAEGGLVDDEPEPAEPNYDREDEELFRDAPEADLPAEGAIETQQQSALPIASPHMKEPTPPRLIPPHPDMNSEQRRTVERLNSYAQAQYRQELQLYRQALGQQQRAIQDQNRRTQQEKMANQRTLYREQEATRRNKDRIEAEQRAAERKLQAEREKDPEYRLGRSLAEADEREQNYNDIANSEAPVDTSRYRASNDAGRIKARADNSPSRQAFKTDFETRSEPIGKALKVIEAEGLEEARTGKVDAAKLPKFDSDLRRKMTDATDALSRFNDMNPETLARAAYDFTQKLDVKPVVNRDGTVSIGNTRVVMDDATFRQLAMLRGERMAALAKVEEAGRVKKQTEGAIEFARRQDIDNQDRMNFTQPVKAGRRLREMRQRGFAPNPNEALPLD